MPDPDVVASVRNLGLSETDLENYCQEYLSTLPVEARSNVPNIISHDGFWSFVLKIRTGIGRIETPREPVSPELAGTLASAAWRYLKQDQGWSNAQDDSVASSFAPSEIAAPSLGDVMPDFPATDSPSSDHAGPEAFGQDIATNSPAIFDVDGEEPRDFEDPVVD